MFALRLTSLLSLVARPSAFRPPEDAESVTTAAAETGTAAATETCVPPPSPVHAIATPRALPDRPAAGSASRTSMTGPEPEGIRVVPLRPESAWPHGRARGRVPNPFRAFPYRSLHLVRMMAPADPND